MRANAKHLHYGGKGKLEMFDRITIHWEILLSGPLCHNIFHNNYVVGYQVVLPYYKHVNSVFICSNRGRNIHKDTISNGRSTWRTLYVQRYIKTDKIYPSFFTSRTLLVQGMHQDNEPQGGVKIMQDLPLSIIYSKWTLDYNSNYIYIYNTLSIGDKPAWINKIGCIKK